MDCSALNVSHEYSARSSLVAASGAILSSQNCRSTRRNSCCSSVRVMGCMVKSLPQRQDYRGPMPALLARRMRVVLLAAATLLLLTGCVKLDVDLTVGSDDKVSGTFIVGIDKSLLQFTGQDGDALYNQITSDFDQSAAPAGSTVTT